MTAALLITMLYAIHAAVFADYVADDGGISLAYARNFANGHGLSLNPGGVPVEGYSNPLWILLLSGAVGAGLDRIGDEWLLKGLGLLLGLGTLFLMPALARRAYGTEESVPWFAPTLLVVWTPYVFWAGGGLENALYSFVLVLAAVLHLDETTGRPRAPWSALALAAVAITRPEGCAFFLAFLVHRVLVRGRRPAGSGSALAVWFAVFVVLYGAFLLWRYQVFGAWLPNTYYAKVWGRSLTDLGAYLTDPSDRGWMYLRGFSREAWPVLAVAALGLTDHRFWKGNLLFCGILGGQALYIIFVGGDWWHAWRFLTPALPFIAVAGQHGVHRTTAVVKRRELVTALAAAIVGVVTAHSLHASYELRLREQEDKLIGLRGRRDQAQKIRAFAEAAHIDRPRYLETDIGGPALTGGLTIVDLGMLTDIHLARFQYYPPMFRQYIFQEQRPHFIRTHSTWTRSSRVTEYPEFLEQYLPIHAYRDHLGLHGEFVRKDLFVEASDGTPAAVRFGEIALVTFEPRSLRATAAGRGTFTWRWRCEQKCRTDYWFEVILAGSDGTSERRRFQPVFGWYPTAQWQAGEVVRVAQSFDIPAWLGPGVYRVSVRAVSRDSEPPPVEVATLHVPADAAAPPESEDADASSVDGASDSAVAETDRARVSALVARAEEHLKRRDYPGAFSALRDAVERDPSNARLRRRLEDARERMFWIEYYAQTRRYRQLLRMFDEEWHAGTLPQDRGRLEELYYGLLGAGDEQRAGRVRAIAGFPQRPAVTLYERGTAVLALIDYRFELREPETMTRLHLFFKVLRAPTRNVDVWLHLQPRDGEPTPIHQPPARATSRWKRGSIVSEEILLWPPAGEYEVRASMARHDGTARLCTEPVGTRCDMSLGWRNLGRP